MRKKMILLMCLLMGVSIAQAQLNIDFSSGDNPARPGTGSTPVEEGYQGWLAFQETPSTFVPQTFNAFGTEITISVTWPNNPPAAGPQLWNRAADYRYNYETTHEDLISDWVGSDCRETGANPLRLTISGLPKKNYSWLSYHHDPIDQTGIFDVNIVDADGPRHINDVNITDSTQAEGGDQITDFEEFATFSTTLLSNGTDDIVLEFWLDIPAPADEEIYLMFFLMNGFEMEIISSREAAQKPVPGSGYIDILRDTSLSWAAGEGAVSHDVYFGTSFEDVNTATRDNDPTGVLVSQGQDTTIYTPPAVLDYGETYYWRVDEEQNNGSFWKENFWNFTVETFTYPIANISASASSENSADEGAGKSVDGSGLTDNQHSGLYSDMWLSTDSDSSPSIQYNFGQAYCLYEMLIWNYSVDGNVDFGLKGVTIEYSLNNSDWEVLGDFELAQATSGAVGPDSTISFDRTVAQYVRIKANSNWGGTKNGLAEVRFMQLPVKARGPQPADEATGVANDVVLTWRPGREAASHDVYISSDRDAVVNGTAPKQSVTEYSLPVADLSFGTIYYWCVDEVNDAITPPLREGDIWSFTVQEYAVVDDFEGYNSNRDAGTTIFQTWSEDGYAESPKFSTNSGQMGHTYSPWVEVDITHDGKKSGPFYYGKGTPTISEASRPIDNADWTRLGLKALTLWFYGNPDNTATQMYVKINGVRKDYDGDPADITRTPWNFWYIDLADPVFAGVDLTNVTKLTIGCEGGEGMVLFDDIALTGFDSQKVTPVEPATTGLLAHYTFNGSLTDSAGDNDGEMLMEEGALDPPIPTFVKGVDGQAISLDGIREFFVIDGSFDLPQYTITTWFRVTGGQADRCFFSAYTFDAEEGEDIIVDPNGTHGLLLQIRSNGSIRYLHRAPIGSNGASLFSDGGLDDGEWYHVAAVKSVDTITLYINGVVVDSDTDENVLDAPLTEISVGILAPGKLEGDRRYFPGNLDEMRLYDRALSQAEVAYLAGRTITFYQP